MSAVLERREVAEFHRGYSILTLKSVDSEKRTIEGIASTPSADRMGDIVELDGIEMSLPLPFLYQHNAGEPIGWVQTAKKTGQGLTIKVQIAPAGTHPDIDRAWTYIKSGLVRGLSIGFRSLEHAWMDDGDGIRFIRSELFEISAVTIPANADANITSVKSIDSQLRSALGDTQKGIVRLTSKTSPGVTGSTKGKTMTVQENISQFENKRAANQARMDEIMTKSGADGATLDETLSQEFDGLETENEQIDKHLVRLRNHQKNMLAKAQPVVAAASPESGAAVRRGEPIQVKSNAPKGIGVARMAIAVMKAHGNPYQAIEIAKQYWPDSPEVAMYMKSVIEAGDTTTSGWASQLLPAAQQMSGEFLDMLRDAIIIGRVPGFKRVPFNVSVPLQSGAGTYGWVGEGAPKPVTKPTYGSATLRFEKAAGIIVITEELARFSNPSAEVLVRDEMIKGLTNFFDTTFVGAAAAVSNVSPAGIRNGISATAASGTTAARFRYDMNIIIQNMITNKQDPSQLVLLMSAGIAMSLSSMINTLGQAEFPTINANGGNYLGIPIVVSQALGTNIILCSPDQILLAEDPAVRIDVSREATVEMDTNPAVGESSPITDNSTTKSLWQNNLVGIRCEQFRTWKVARSSAVEYISGAAYTPPTS